MSIEVFSNQDQLLATQDIQDFKDYAELKREIDRYGTGSRSTTFRPHCIVPDIVGVDIHTRYGINHLDPNFLHDKTLQKRFFHIIATEFPELLTSNATTLSLNNSGVGPAIIIK